MNTVRIGVIGLGQRGYSIAKDVLMNIDHVDITAGCDVYEDRNERLAEVVKEKRGHGIFTSTDYNEILKREDVDAVYVATSWDTHVEIAIAALRAGMPCAMEVGGAYSIDELYRLVHAYEDTKTPFMMMENCCFNRDELLATSVARSGKLGEIVHCSGAYSHDLRSEVANGNIIRHYRLNNYLKRNTENYPTHELGPIAKILGINRGNRMVSLVSVASKAAGMEQYIKDHPELVEKDPTLEGARFAQGDIVNTIITCAGGQTIALKLDTTLPRSYSRELTVRGTKGAYFMDTDTVFLDGMKEYWDPRKFADDYMRNAKEYEKDYLPSYWTEITEEQKKTGHGGMDRVMWLEFTKCLSEGLPFPIDVYDAAAWMAVTALSEQSVAEGGMPKAIPDFTDGKWLTRKNCDVLEFPWVKSE